MAVFTKIGTYTSFHKILNVFIFITAGHSDLRLLATKILLVAGGHFLCGQEEE